MAGFADKFLVSHFHLQAAHVSLIQGKCYKIEMSDLEMEAENKNLSLVVHVVHTNAKQVVYGTRTVVKCAKMKKGRAKRVKLLIFIVKYANV